MKETITYIVTDRGGVSQYGNLDAPTLDEAMRNATAMCERSQDGAYPKNMNELEIHKKTLRMEKMEITLGSIAHYHMEHIQLEK